MTTTTLDWLSDLGDKPDNYGNVYLNMKFGDGTLAYKAGKPADMEKHEHALRSFEDSSSPHEFLFEDTGKKTQKGEPKLKLVGYPGWAAQAFQPGGSGPGKPRDETGMAIGAAGHDAAVIVAAIVTPGCAPDDAFSDYQLLVKMIYENNQSLRATTPPGAAAETGAGASPPPASNTSSEPQKRTGEKTVPSGNGGGSDDWGAGAETPARGGGTCSHKLWTEFKPDNETPLPKGYHRCIECQEVFRAA
jgi:hypothetical protein